ncbi:condensation domain-containing protein [Bacillus sp. CB102A.1]
MKHEEQEFEFFDFSNVENTNLLEEWIEQKTKDTFTLFNSDLYYFALIKLNDNECAVFGNVHHIIMDGLSIQIFTEQIANIIMKCITRMRKAKLKIHMFNS